MMLSCLLSTGKNILAGLFIISSITVCDQLESRDGFLFPVLVRVSMDPLWRHGPRGGWGQGSKLDLRSVIPLNVSGWNIIMLQYHHVTTHSRVPHDLEIPTGMGEVKGISYCAPLSSNPTMTVCRKFEWILLVTGTERMAFTYKAHQNTSLLSNPMAITLSFSKCRRG